MVALKPARRVEVLALLARMQIKPALRALPECLTQILQQRPALRATRNRPRARHVHRPRSKRQVFSRRRLLKRFLRFAPGILASRILVSALAVLAIGQKHLPKPTHSPLLRLLAQELLCRPFCTGGSFDSRQPFSLSPHLLLAGVHELSFTYPGATIRTRIYLGGSYGGS